MKIEPLFYKNLLLISGTGRNTGKTSLACELIRQWAGHGIRAIKMSCHFYPQQDMELLSEKPGKYEICREFNSASDKDSSRMLAAGAHEVFYIQAARDAAFEAFCEICPLIPSGVPVLCESGGLGLYLQPGLHVVMNRPQPLSGDKKIDYQPDVFIEMTGAGFSLPPAHFLFENGEWKLQPQ